MNEVVEGCEHLPLPAPLCMCGHHADQHYSIITGITKLHGACSQRACHCIHFRLTDDLGADRDSRVKPCSARLDNGWWCLLPNGHTGPHSNEQKG